MTIDRIGKDISTESAQRSCFDKCRYMSKNTARDKAARLTKRHGVEQIPYHCLVCGAWHLSTALKRDAKAIKNRVRLAR